MAETLTISDGTTTIDFLGSNYEILHEGGWSPKRAQLKESIMGGQAPYHNVVERMAIKINGTSESDVLDKLQDLSDLFDQVDRWAAGGVVTAVYIEYEPSNTGLGGTVPQAVIVGPEPGTDYIQLPSDFTYIYKEGRYQLGTNSDPVIITFMRRPWWLYSTDAKSAAASSGNPAVMTTSTFTDNAKVFMPYDLQLVSSFDTSLDDCHGYIITTNDASLIQYFEAEDMTIINATYQADQVVAAASNGNISEIDGDLPTAQTGALQASLSSPGDALLWGVFCSVKNLSSSYPWRIRGGFYSADLSDFVSPTPWKTLNESDYANPTPIFLGYISTPSEQSLSSIFTLRIQAEHDTVGVDGTDDLQIDYVCLVGIDGSTNIIKVTNIFTTAQDDDTFIIQHRLDSHVKPWAWTAASTTAPAIYSAVDGNRIFTSLGNSISCIVLANDGAGQWVHEDNLGEVNITLTATRHIGYLTPL